MQHQNSRFLTREYAGTVELISRIIDAFSIICSAYIIYQFFDVPKEGTNYLALLILIKTLVCFIVFREGQLYRSWRGRPYSDQFSRLVLAYLMSGIIVTAVWLILNIKDLIETLPFFLWLFFSLLLIISIRAVAYTTVREFRKRGINQKKIIVFGVGNLGKSLIEQIRKSPESGYQIFKLVR